MTSSVSICSNALLTLGAQTINSLTEPNDRARLCANLYESVRDSVLRSHPWHCAIKRVALAPDVATPIDQYAFQFSLPSDWLDTLQVGQNDLIEDYRTEGRKLLADTNPLYLRYVFRNDVEATWDSMLIDAMTLTMASRMAYPLTKSSSLAQLAKQDVAVFMRQARTKNGQGDPPLRLGDFPLIQARYSKRNWL